jgi:uncharacterized membrane protein
MFSRLVGVGAIIAAGALLIWRGPFTIPSWAIIAFVVALFPMAVVLSVKRMRLESRMARTVWLALTGK